MSPNVSDMPLSVAFDEGIKLWQKMNAGSASQEEKNRAVDLLKRCHTLTEALALFSSNEQLEDISTGDLKYLLVPYYLADFQSSSGSTILQERVQIANEALQHYREFLDRCEEYDLLGSNKAVYQREEEGLPIDANTKRTIKVDRFKRQKAIDSHIATIESRRKKATDGVSCER
jgi:immunoglobulin-binding protein 1